MSRDIRDLLHGAAPDPSGRPDVDAIRRRGRTLVATRVAAIASVVVLVAAGATGLVLQILPDEDVPPPVIEEPTPPPTGEPDPDVEACQPAPYRPTYLPWLDEGERAGEPSHIVPGDDAEPNARTYWPSDPSAFDPGEPEDSPVVIVATHFELDLEIRTGDVPTVEVAGHEGELIWVGDPGVGELTIFWRERPGPCGTFGVSLLTYGMGAYLEDEPGLDAAEALEMEIQRIAVSLVHENDLEMTCAEDGPFPEIADDEVWVFFYCDDPHAALASLYATVRDVPDGQEPLAVALEALAAGPTATERDAGFRSTLAEMGEISVLETAVDGSTAVIDLTGLPDELTQEQRSFLPPGFLEEIAWTVFHNDDAIDAIELRLDGSCDDFWQLLTGEECRQYTRNQWGHIPEE